MLALEPGELLLESIQQAIRETDLVRYETVGKSKEYWLKDRQILRLLDALEELVELMRRKP